MEKLDATDQVIAAVCFGLAISAMAWVMLAISILIG